jgi:hypothetical protein
MHEHEQDDPEVLSEIEKLGYDPRDVPVEQTPKHAFFLFFSCFLVGLVAWGVMAAIDRFEGSKSTGRQELPVRRSEPKDPYPLLQTNMTAKTDIHKLRAEEQVKTDTAGWVDEGKGVARIPVSVAIEKLLSEGMPQTSTQGAPQSVTGVDPSAPGKAVDSTLSRPGGGGQ